MKQAEIGCDAARSEGAVLAGMAAALDAAYAALGDSGSRAATAGTGCLERGGESGSDDEASAASKREHESVSRLLFHFLAGLRCDYGFRMDYQGLREFGGTSLFWDNATIQTDVDDCEVIPGAFDLELRLGRFLTLDEIGALEEQIAERLYPATVEIWSELSSEEEGTHLYISARFLEG